MFSKDYRSDFSRFTYTEVKNGYKINDYHNNIRDLLINLNPKSFELAVKFKDLSKILGYKTNNLLTQFKKLNLPERLFFKIDRSICVDYDVFIKHFCETIQYSIRKKKCIHNFVKFLGEYLQSYNYVIIKKRDEVTKIDDKVSVLGPNLSSNLNLNFYQIHYFKMFYEEIEAFIIKRYDFIDIEAKQTKRKTGLHQVWNQYENLIQNEYTRLFENLDSNYYFESKVNLSKYARLECRRSVMHYDNKMEKIPLVRKKINKNIIYRKPNIFWQFTQEEENEIQILIDKKYGKYKEPKTRKSRENKSNKSKCVSVHLAI